MFRLHVIHLFGNLDGDLVFLMSLNNLLYHLSDDLKDYVIKHELVHTKVKNHGKEFWNMLESVCENSKKKRYSLNNSYFIKTY